MRELGDGYRMTLNTRMGWPKLARMKSPATVTAETARNSPRITIFPNAFQSCR